MASDGLKSMIRHSIVIFFTMAVFFFVMIFLLSAAIDHKQENSTDDSVPIQQDQVQTWGEIPGKLQITSQQDLNLYGFRYNITSTSTDIAMTKSDPISYTGARTFTDVVWSSTKSVVEYKIDNEVGNPNEQETLKADDTQYLYPNLGAINTWTQMQDKPRFMLAWEAINQATNILFESEILNRFYAYNSLYYMFDDYELVQQYVLYGLSEDDQSTIYNDPNFGMNSVKGLTWWISACMHGSDSADYVSLTSYYKSKGIVLTDTMNYAVGPKSMIAMITNVLSQQIRTDPNLYQTTGSINKTEIAQAQWGNCATIADNMMVGLPTTYSFADMDEVFSYPPEFGAYVIGQTGNATAAFDILDAKTLIAKDPTSYVSFLNNENLQYFYETYAVDEFDALKQRFGFVSDDQIQYFYDYLEQLVDQSLLQNSTSYEPIALGTLFNKQINATFGFLERTLPLQVASRVVCSISATVDYGTDDPCTYYFNQAGITDTDTVTAMCDGVDFTNPNSVDFLINPTWYGGDYLQSFKDQGSLTDDQVTDFYDTTNDNSFGKLLLDSTTAMSTQYGCTISTNCTGLELASQQYGSSLITMGPSQDWSSTFFPIQNSVAGWGDVTWEPYGPLTRNPEFSFYSKDADQGTLSTSLAGKLGSDNSTFYGLSNKVMCQILTRAYYSGDQDTLDQFTTWYGSGFDLTNYIESIRQDIEYRFFGDAYTYYTVDMLVNGFTSDSADLINGGEYYDGDDFSLNDFTTPIFHDSNGVLKDTVYGMYTGANDLDAIGYLRLINGVAAVNKLQTLWSGVTDDLITVKRPFNVSAGESLSNIDLDKVSYGMQFPPGMEQSTIRAYNERTINIESFEFDSEDSIGSGLKTYKYKTQTWPGSLQFASSLPTFEEAYGCYGCDKIVGDERAITIDDLPYTLNTEEPDNYIITQPESGYTYERKYQSSVLLVLGGNQTIVTDDSLIPTPFPSLDPLYGVAVPLYDLNMTISADEQTFVQKFDYISTSTDKTRTIVISFSILAAVSLILGIVALVMHKMMGSERSNSRDDLLERHPEDD